MFWIKEKISDSKSGTARYEASHQEFRWWQLTISSTETDCIRSANLSEFLSQLFVVVNQVVLSPTESIDIFWVLSSLTSCNINQKLPAGFEFSSVASYLIEGWCRMVALPNYLLGHVHVRQWLHVKLYCCEFIPIQCYIWQSEFILQPWICEKSFVLYVYFFVIHHNQNQFFLSIMTT